MTRRSLSLAVLLSASLAGCMTLPRTPELTRKSAQSGAALTEKDIFEVKRPLPQVADAFQRKAPECLSKRVTGRWMENGVMRRQVRAYKPTVNVSKEHVELILQSRIVEGSTELGGIPPDGWYIVVADAYPVDRNTTRVELYKHAIGHSIVLKAIKGWATGANMGCPDLTQT